MLFSTLVVETGLYTQFLSNKKRRSLTFWFRQFATLFLYALKPEIFNQWAMVLLSVDHRPLGYHTSGFCRTVLMFRASPGRFPKNSAKNAKEIRSENFLFLREHYFLEIKIVKSETDLNSRPFCKKRFFLGKKIKKSETNSK